MVLERLIISSDEDAPIVADISVGFNDRKQLVIELSRIDYDHHKNEEITRATVSFEDARTLAQRLHASTLDIPAILADEFNGESGILYSVSDIKGVFKEILDFLVDYGIHYRLSGV